MVRVTSLLTMAAKALRFSFGVKVLPEIKICCVRDIYAENHLKWIKNEMLNGFQMPSEPSVADLLFQHFEKRYSDTGLPQ